MRREFDSPYPHRDAHRVRAVLQAAKYSRMDKTIIIYSTPTCHFCHMVKDYLTEKGIAFTDHNVAVDIEKRQEMMQRSGQMGVPVIFIGDDMVIGFNKDKIDVLLGIA